ncbi:MAG: hypothetical protein H0W79_07160 [Rubrobacteraceae bacterium]|nr:hypothetical protein [Rubrobacteraceae bacterium]
MRDKLYTYVEAAVLLGKPLAYVNKKVVSGELLREQVDSLWMVTGASLERLLARQGGSGPTPTQSGARNAVPRSRKNAPSGVPGSRCVLRGL